MVKDVGAGRLVTEVANGQLRGINEKIGAGKVEHDSTLDSDIVPIQE